MHKMIDQPAPELSWQPIVLASVEGAETKMPALSSAPPELSDLKGKVVMVNLWATWCPPCRHEMPDLDRLQQDYGDRGFQVVHLSDEDEHTLLKYLEANPMSTRHGRVDRFNWPDGGRPTTYLIDREGVVRDAILGARTYDHFVEMITPLL